MWLVVENQVPVVALTAAVVAALVCAVLLLANHGEDQDPTR